MYICVFDRSEFERHELESVVTITCRDVCTDGFGLEGVADAGIDVGMNSFCFLQSQNLPGISSENVRTFLHYFCFPN